MSKPVRVGLIGAGIFARDTYIPNLDANSGRARLTAILSRTPEPIEETLALLNGGKGDGGTVKRYIGAEGEERFFAEASEICDAVIIVVPIPLLGTYVHICLKTQNPPSFYD
jgi:predicted dehydrogenase